MKAQHIVANAALPLILPPYLNCLYPIPGTGRLRALGMRFDV